MVKLVSFYVVPLKVAASENLPTPKRRLAVPQEWRYQRQNTPHCKSTCKLTPSVPESLLGQFRHTLLTNVPRTQTISIKRKSHSSLFLSSEIFLKNMSVIQLLPLNTTILQKKNVFCRFTERLRKQQNLSLLKRSLQAILMVSFSFT